MHPSLQNTTTYHKHQLKLVVQFILECEGFMGEGVVASPFLERELCLRVQSIPQKTQSWAPQRLPLGKNQTFPQSQTCPRTRGCWGHCLKHPTGEKRRYRGVGGKSERVTRHLGAPRDVVVIETVRSTSSCTLFTDLKVFFHPLSHPSLETRENQAGRSERRERWLV